MFSLISIPGLIALLLALLGGLLLWLGRRQRQRSGLPEGTVLYRDTGEWQETEQTAAQPPLRTGGAPRLSGANARPRQELRRPCRSQESRPVRPSLTPATSCNWRHTVCSSKKTSKLRPPTACCATPTPRCASTTQTNCAAACLKRPPRSGRRGAPLTCAAATVNHSAARPAAIAPPAGRGRSPNSF